MRAGNLREGRGGQGGGERERAFAGRLASQQTSPVDQDEGETLGVPVLFHSLSVSLSLSRFRARALVRSLAHRPLLALPAEVLLERTRFNRRMG